MSLQILIQLQEWQNNVQEYWSTQLIFLSKYSEPCVMWYLYISDEKGIAFCHVANIIQ